ncbi:MAG: type VI secretion system-associated protein TagF [Candidatus Competibacter sp.]|nr:type VI secretion system-associated protein TagF [Candidatus Competibacter sp.]MDG4584034.1 type VI secretion system-associated protein TagF [Candidatus Competibacter sp.]
MTPTLERPAAGFFGKLPSRGDFIGRHLPKSFVGPWDGWLQTAIAHSREQLGENWQEYYCTSPVWRFALGPNLCGSTAYAGIMMPSMDRVGRYYPLAIAAALAPDWPLFALPAGNEEWFRQAERLALAALERDELDLDRFSQQVAELGAPPATGYPATGSAGDGNAWYCPLPQTLETAGISPFLASDLLRRGFPLHSLWWTDGSDWIARCLLICKDLPLSDGFAALLAGNWRQWGWNERAPADIARRTGEPPAAEEEAS